MNAIKLSRVIVSIAVLVLLAGIGMMGSSFLKGSPVTLAVSREEQAVLKGSLFDMYEINKEGNTTVSDYVLADGQVQTSFKIGAYHSTSLMVDQTLSRFPLWHRPPIKKLRDFLQLNGEKLFYTLAPDHLLSEKANLGFTFVRVSDAQEKFEKHEVHLTFDTDFGWIQEPMFQVDGDRLAVLVPLTSTYEGKQNMMLAFVVSLSDGSVMEQKVLDLSTVLGDNKNVMAGLSARTYHPRKMFIQTVEYGSTMGNGTNGFYVYDYFKQQATPIVIQASNANSMVEGYVVEDEVYVLQSSLEPLQTESRYESVTTTLQNRSSVPATLYAVAGDGKTMSMMDLSIDSLSVSAVELAANKLIYIGLQDKATTMNVVDLAEKKVILQVPVQTRETATIRFGDALR